MLSITIPDSSYSPTPVTLGGELYNFVYTYNDIEETFALDIYYQNKLMIGSLSLKEGSIITKKYDLPDFSHGELFLAKVKATDRPPTRDNVGIGKSYELIYVSNTE